KSRSEWWLNRYIRSQHYGTDGLRRSRHPSISASRYSGLRAFPETASSRSLHLLPCPASDKLAQVGNAPSPPVSCPVQLVGPAPNKLWPLLDLQRRSSPCRVPAGFRACRAEDHLRASARRSLPPVDPGSAAPGRAYRPRLQTLERVGL